MILPPLLLASAGCPKSPFLLMTSCFCLMQYSPLATEMASLSRKQQNGQQTGLSHVIFLKYFPRNEMTSFKMSSAQGKYFFIKQKCVSSSFHSNRSLKYVTWNLQLHNNLIPYISLIIPFSVSHFHFRVPTPAVPVTYSCRSQASHFITLNFVSLSLKWKWLQYLIQKWVKEPIEIT